MKYQIMLKRHSFTSFSPFEYTDTIEDARAIIAERTGLDCSSLEPGEVVDAGGTSLDGPWYKIEEA